METLSVSGLAELVVAWSGGGEPGFGSGDEDVVDGGAIVVDIRDEPDAPLPAGTAERLGALPRVVIGITGVPHGLTPPAGRAPETGQTGQEGDWPPSAGGVAARLDVLVAEAEGAAEVVDAVRANPRAAMALVWLLRDSDSRSIGAGLVTESATYSALQGGPEFARWLEGHRARGRPPRPEQEAPAVRLERSGDRLTLTLNRPHVRNALNARMREELLDGLAVATADPSVTEVVLRGEGPSFCSGGDLDEFGTFADPASAHLVRLARSPARALAGLADRVVAHVHGTCVGAGIELPAFAHHVVAAPDATFRLPEIAMGLVPGAGGTVSLPRRIGRQRTAWLALTGRAIDAPTALTCGLVDEVAPPTDSTV